MTIRSEEFPAGLLSVITENRQQGFLCEYHSRATMTKRIDEITRIITEKIPVAFIGYPHTAHLPSIDPGLWVRNAKKVTALIQVQRQINAVTRNLL